jgi:hypothetical protein
MIPAAPVLAPLDALRRGWLRALGPVGVALVRDRALRVRVGGLFGIAFALACALTAPVLLLAVSPLLLGIPHLLSDLRYLVVKPGLHRRPALALAAGLPLLLAFAGFTILAAVLASAAAALVARAPTSRRVTLAALIAGAGAVALGFGWTAVLVFAHAHNAIAVWMWWRLRPRSAGDLVVPLAWALALAAIALGAADGALLRFDLAGWSAATQLDRLAPGLPAPWDERLVVSFAFAQSVHYAVWLRLVPDDLRARETPRSFASTWRALVTDLGRPLVVGSALALVALVAFALVDVARANELYLRIALFHGPLEVAFLALAAAERT